MKFQEEEWRSDEKRNEIDLSSDLVTEEDNHEKQPRVRERSPRSHHSIIFLRTAVSGTVRYRECIGNQAAGIGGIAYDGCCGFIPSTRDPVKCATCGCDRSFHRIEPVAEEDLIYDYFSGSKKSEQSVEAEEEEVREKEDHSPEVVAKEDYSPEVVAREEQEQSTAKKRFKSKFTAEQKEKMKEFADEIGWKVSNRSKEEIERFCSEVGVKKVNFRVWMNNNRAKGK